MRLICCLVKRREQTNEKIKVKTNEETNEETNLWFLTSNSTTVTLGYERNPPILVKRAQPHLHSRNATESFSTTRTGCLPPQNDHTTMFSGRYGKVKSWWWLDSRSLLRRGLTSASWSIWWSHLHPKTCRNLRCPFFRHWILRSRGLHTLAQRHLRNWSPAKETNERTNGEKRNERTKRKERKRKERSDGIR